MSDENTLLNYMSSVIPEENRVGSAEVATTEPPVSENQDSAEVAADTVENNTVTAPEPEVIQEEVQNQQPEVLDYWKQFEEKTQGLVKDEESFNAIIEKAKEHDSLRTAKEEFEKNQWKPANDYIKALNDLTSQGASKDQVKAFVKLNEYGDLNELSPLDAKVAKMVLVDGYNENIARKIVQQEFDLDQYEEGTDEHEIAKEKLRVSSQGDVQALQTYKKELSVVDNPAQAQAEQERLTEIANTAAYNKIVSQEVPKIVQHFPTKMSYSFSEGETKVPFEYNIDKGFVEKELPNLINDYFKDTKEQINQETVKDAYEYAYASYLLKNHQNMINSALKEGYSKGKVAGVQETSNKYENRSGLPKPVETMVTDQNVAANKEFRDRLLGRV